MAYLFSVALGPAQEFIAAARRTRDLWFSSYLLSELSKAAARAIGKDKLIFPAIDDLVRRNPARTLPQQSETRGAHRMQPTHCATLMIFCVSPATNGLSEQNDKYKSHLISYIAVVMENEPIDATPSRLTRLLELIREIKSNPRQTPEHLRCGLKISRSQFFADKKALAQIGFVFEYDRQLGRYVIKKDKYLPVADLTAVEALSLVMAVRQISATGDHTLTFDAVKAIKKIIANSDKRVRELLEYAMDDDVLKARFKVDSHIIEELWQAQERNTRLAIQYDDFSQGRERQLEIDPYAIYFKGRALYLDAYVAAEQKVLMLRVSRIKQILRPLGNFAVRTDYNFGARHRHSYRVFIKNEPPQLVRIQFSPHAARYIDETYHHPSQKKLRGDDGSLILSLTVSEPREVLWYLVFPWGDEAEILEPQWLRKEAARMAQDIVSKYHSTKKDSQ